MSDSPDLLWGVLYVSSQEIYAVLPTHESALEWVGEWIEDGGLPDAFAVVYRELGPWRSPSDPNEKKPDTA